MSWEFGSYLTGIGTNNMMGVQKIFLLTKSLIKNLQIILLKKQNQMYHK